MSNINDPYDEITNFFTTFHDDPKLVGKYRQLVSEAFSRGEFHIEIMFEDILAHSESLARYFQEYPEKAINHSIEVFMNLYAQEDPTIHFNPLDYEVRIISKNNTIDMKLRDISADHIEKLVIAKGVLIKMTSPKPQIIVAQYECAVCQARQSFLHDIDEFDLRKPEICSNPNCTNKKKFVLLKDLSEFINYQSIVIQESPEDLIPGDVPRSIKLIIQKKLVDTIHPGERVKITGIYKIEPIESNRGMKSSLCTTYIRVIGIEHLQTDDEDDDVTPAQLVEIKRLSLLPDIHTILKNSIAPQIFGQDYLKQAALCTLFGGVSAISITGEKRRGDIHTLFMGDPGTGKSQILLFCSKLVPRSVYTSGKGASAAGLTAAVIRETDSSGYSLEVGAMVLASKGICAIDEFDKMDKKDRSAIHQGMEQQTISISKAGINATLNAQTSILAAANPKEGRYNEFKLPIENINLPSPILTRFDILLIVIDKPEKEFDTDVAYHILGMENTEDDSSRENRIINTIIPFDMLKRYINHARNHVFPRLTNEAKKILINFYCGLREISAQERSFAIVPRYLEGLNRMTQAFAKMQLKDVADVDHAKMAIGLMAKSMRDIGLDPDTGTIDIDRIHTPQAHSLKEKVKYIITLITRIQKEKDNAPIKLADFYKEVEMEGKVKKETAYEVIEKLRDEMVIYEPHSGEIKLCRDV